MAQMTAAGAMERYGPSEITTEALLTIDDPGTHPKTSPS